MLITLTRTNKTDDGIFGKFALDWNPFTCYTIENKEKAILPGTFPIEFTYSPKFNRIMPLVIVPDRVGIRIHWGNIPANYEGCIGVGNRADVRADSIDNTVTTFNEMYKIISLPAGVQLKIVEAYV